METITTKKDYMRIPKAEYLQLKRLSSAYLNITKTILEDEGIYPYDYEYINTLRREALRAYREGSCIEAKSVDEALARFQE